MAAPPPQACFRCKEIVSADRKSCPVLWKDTLGQEPPPTPKSKARFSARQIVITGVLAIAFAFWMWSGLVSMRAYDLQAIPRETAERIQVGMTHRQVVDLVGRDAAPISVGEDFKDVRAYNLAKLAENAQASLKARGAAACNLESDAACGAFYPVKDGSGLRILYDRGIVSYVTIAPGNQNAEGRNPR
jgi:hypothetical protein